MYTIAGETDLVRFFRLRIWAERGLIHIEDTRTGAYHAVAVRTMLHRMQAISDMLANSREDMKRSGFMHADVYETHQRWLEHMTDVIRKAQEQGMPSDASARRDHARRRAKTVCVPTALSAI